MEKITKKKKTKKGLKKRIGLIAIGGLSLVLTICLSVGATLAWFAGSTWSSNQLYMGGPVYVEMAGRGSAGGADGIADGAKWVGGAGNLDIKAATSRTTGTSVNAPATIPNNILLPGQKFEIYSQARVFSTAYTTSVGENKTTSGSSGANTTNTEKSGTAHITDKGRITSTTTSVLRARFSISIDFDPSVGFNNFTDESYRDNYPVQSGLYTGHYAKDDGSAELASALTEKGLAWTAALGGKAFKNPVLGTGKEGEGAIGTQKYTAGARRDAVNNHNGETEEGVETRIYTDKIDATDLVAVKNGTLKSIYKWKFVSADEYSKAVGNDDGKGIDSETPLTGGAKYAKMAAPFDGSDKSTNSQGYYGCWILTGAAENNAIAESDAFYKARCNSYIDSYVEEYITEYGDVKTRTIGDSIKALENSLNQSFVQLVNDSSDAIIAGKVFGMTVTGGQMTYAGTEAQQNAVKASTQASWLYIDPLIGNDTNTSEISTSTGGWWYLVESDAGSCKINDAGNSANLVTKEVDSTYYDTESRTWKVIEGAPEGASVSNNVPKATAKAISRNDVAASNSGRLDAKLFAINPLLAKEAITTNNAENDVTKVVSYSFPFVNGTSALPADALTNVFANAKITFQISFQAIQAFFPYSTNIDKMDYTNPLLGTAKALSIRNAIPIYNEAFDYQENVGVNSIVGL